MQPALPVAPLHVAAPQVSLQMGEAAFAGKYEPSRDGLDCIAIFDGTSLRLELLGATVKNLRCAARVCVWGRGGPRPPAAASPTPAVLAA